MKKLLVLLALLLLLPTTSWAAIAFVSSVSAGSTDGNTFTTGSFDTTGANLLVCGVAHYSALTPTFSDSKSNTYTTNLTDAAGAQNKVLLIYAINPTVGSGHTVTVTGTAYASIACYAFSGADTSAPFDVESSDSANAATSVIPGTVVTASESVTVTDLSIVTGTGQSINSAFSTPITVAFVTNFHYGVSVAYKINAGTVTPTWSWTTADDVATSIASFKVAGAGGGGGSVLQSPSSGALSVIVGH